MTTDRCGRAVRANIGPLHELLSTRDVQRWFDGHRWNDRAHLAIQTRTCWLESGWAKALLWAECFMYRIIHTSSYTNVPVVRSTGSSWALLYDTVVCSRTHTSLCRVVCFM